MPRTQVRFGRLALTATLLLSGAALAGRAAAGTSQPDPVTRHEVVAGDTLWAIARAQVGTEADPRPLVDAIRRANDLSTSALVPGQVLLVPAP